MTNQEIYMKKENRDAKYRELKQQGFNPKKSKDGSSLLHPMYVKDWPNQLTEQDKGFGNTIYKTSFSNLYFVDW